MTFTISAISLSPERMRSSTARSRMRLWVRKPRRKEAGSRTGPP